MHLLINSICPIKIHDRGVAKPGIAAGLGPVDRRFKSCRPDQIKGGCTNKVLKKFRLKLNMQLLLSDSCHEKSKNIQTN